MWALCSISFSLILILLSCFNADAKAVFVYAGGAGLGDNQSQAEDEGEKVDYARQILVSFLNRGFNVKAFVGSGSTECLALIATKSSLTPLLDRLNAAGRLEAMIKDDVNKGNLVNGTTLKSLLCNGNQVRPNSAQEFYQIFKAAYDAKRAGQRQYERQLLWEKYYGELGWSARKYSISNFCNGNMPVFRNVNDLASSYNANRAVADLPICTQGNNGGTLSVAATVPFLLHTVARVVTSNINQDFSFPTSSDVSKVKGSVGRFVGNDVEKYFTDKAKELRGYDQAIYFFHGHGSVVSPGCKPITSENIRLSGRQYNRELRPLAPNGHGLFAGPGNSGVCLLSVYEKIKDIYVDAGNKKLWSQEKQPNVLILDASCKSGLSLNAARHAIIPSGLSFDWNRSILKPCVISSQTVKRSYIAGNGEMDTELAYLNNRAICASAPIIDTSLDHGAYSDTGLLDTFLKRAEDKTRAFKVVDPVLDSYSPVSATKAYNLAQVSGCPVLPLGVDNTIPEFPGGNMYQTAQGYGALVIDDLNRRNISISPDLQRYVNELANLPTNNRTHYNACISSASAQFFSDLATEWDQKDTDSNYLCPTAISYANYPTNAAGNKKACTFSSLSKWAKNSLISCTLQSNVSLGVNQLFMGIIQERIKTCQTNPEEAMNQCNGFSISSHIGNPGVLLE